jgi:hypothetical protein
MDHSATVAKRRKENRTNLVFWIPRPPAAARPIDSVERVGRAT